VGYSDEAVADTQTLLLWSLPDSSLPEFPGFYDLAFESHAFFPFACFSLISACRGLSRQLSRRDNIYASATAICKHYHSSLLFLTLTLQFIAVIIPPDSPGTPAWRRAHGRKDNHYKKMLSRDEAIAVCAWNGWHPILRAHLEMFFDLKDRVEL